MSGSSFDHANLTKLLHKQIDSIPRNDITGAFDQFFKMLLENGVEIIYRDISKRDRRHVSIGEEMVFLYEGGRLSLWSWKGYMPGCRRQWDADIYSPDSMVELIDQLRISGIAVPDYDFYRSPE